MACFYRNSFKGPDSAFPFHCSVVTLAWKGATLLEGATHVGSSHVSKLWTTRRHANQKSTHCWYQTYWTSSVPHKSWCLQDKILMLCFNLSALFTVKVLQPRYTAEYGSDVIMGCHFPVHSPLNLMGLSVSWQRKLSLGDKEVYKLNNGQEDLTHQDSDYHGRASLSHEELDKGLSLLSITNIKLTDAGDYICVVKYEGADYKYITLSVEGW